MTRDSNLSSDPTPQKLKFSEVVWGSLAFGLAGAFLVLIVGMWRWERLEVFLGGYLLGVVLPVTLVVFILSKKPATTIVALFVVLITGAPLGAWHLAAVRVELVGLFGWFLPTRSLLKGLEDDDLKVARAVCLVVVSKGYEEVRFVSEAFARRPTSSILCLTKEVPETDADELLRRDLVLLWEKSVLEDPEAQCSAVDGYTKLAPLVHEDVAARLLRMSFAAANPTTEQCARKAFNDAYPTPRERLDGLGNPENVGRNVGPGLFDALIAAGYSSTASDANKALMEEKMLSQWTLSLGCSLLGRDQDDSRTIRSLNQAMVAGNCGAATGENSSAIWNSTCEEGVSATTGFVTQARLCRLIGKHAREEAISFAQTLVHSGIELLQWRATKEKVEAGFAQRAGAAYAQRFVPTDLLDGVLDSSQMPVGMSYDMRGVSGAVRAHSAPAVKQIQGGYLQKMPVSSKMLEIFVSGAEGGSFMGKNFKDLIAKNGGDPDEVFSDANIRQAKLALKKKKKEEEDEDEDEFAFEDLFGNDKDEQAMAEELKKKRRKRKRARKKSPTDRKAPWEGGKKK